MSQRDTAIVAQSFLEKLTIGAMPSRDRQSAILNLKSAIANQAERCGTPAVRFVLDLGGAYQSACPVRSLCNFRVMLRLCGEHGFRLADAPRPSSG